MKLQVIFIFNVACFPGIQKTFNKYEIFHFSKLKVCVATSVNAKASVQLPVTWERTGYAPMETRLCASRFRKREVSQRLNLENLIDFFQDRNQWKGFVEIMIAIWVEILARWNDFSTLWFFCYFFLCRKPKWTFTVIELLFQSHFVHATQTTAIMHVEQIQECCFLSPVWSAWYFGCKIRI